MKINNDFLQRKKNGIIALSILITVVLVLTITHSESTFFQDLLSSMCVTLRGPVTIICYLCLAFLAFLVFSKYGSIRLGGSEARPEMSTWSWLSCLFMAGCGIGIVFYCQEPILHLHSNPYTGKVPGDPTSVAYSLALFNWTINDWIQYAVLGIIISYFHYNKHRDLKLSSVLPERTPTWVRSVIDILMALGVIAGLTTSLGLGVTQISKGFAHVFNFSVSPYILMLGLAIVATWSVSSGIHKGIKWLSNISTGFVCLILVIVLCIGIFRLGILNFIPYIAKGTGLLLLNYFSYNDFYNSASDSWAAAYPIFFDLWFAAWAAFVAVFIARVSKGRTLRQLAIGVVFFPTLFTILWFGIFGCIGVNYSNLIYNSMQQDVPTALFIFLEQICGSTLYIILSSIILIMICLFFITSSDSGSYVVSTLLSKTKTTGSKDKIFWALIQCFVAMGLFMCGGLALIQSVSVIMGLIVFALIIIGAWFFIYKVRKDTKK